MKYAGPLLERMSCEYAQLAKIQLRLTDYTTLSKVLHNHFNNREDPYKKLFNKLGKGYHREICN